VIEKIILGTAQFGLNYGINNSAGKPFEKEVFEILDTAIGNGINCLDTADAYGNSAEVIGNFHSSRSFKFKILNKFKNVNHGKLAQMARKSLDALKISQFEAYSYHSYNDYLNNQLLLNDLIGLKSEGLIKKTGVSVYNNSEAERVIEDINIDVIQFPYNLLDNSNLRGVLIDRAKQRGKEVHVRSVFLQGLFFMDFDRFPKKLLLLKPYIQKIRDFCRNESITIESLALSYALFNNKIDGVLIGVDNNSQLLRNIESIHCYQEAFDFINNFVFVKETDLLNPVNWK
jgi:uncharacterized protein